MKGSYLMAVAFAAMVTVIAAQYDDDIVIPTRCPAIDSMNETVHLAHEYDCTLFYKCSMGRKVLQKCPKMENGERLHFNAKLQVCDWPWKAGCDDSVNTPGDGYDQTTPPYYPVDCPTIIGDDYVRIRDPYSCDGYYECTEDGTEKKTCEEGRHFNPDLQACDMPINVNCTIVDNPDDPNPPKPTTTTKAPPVFPGTGRNDCPKSGKAFLEHECDCNKFYYCDEGDQFLHRCPNGQHFDIDLKACDLEENVGCDKNQPTRCPRIGNVKLPHESSCSKFYDCKNGKESLMNCQAGLHFNPLLGVCEHPDDANCKLEDWKTTTTTKKPTPTPTPTTTTTTKKPTPTPKPKPTPTPTTTTTTTTTTTRRPTPTPSTTTIKSDDGDNGCPTIGRALLPHEELCDHFYVCENGKKSIQKCIDGRHFDREFQTCDFPDSVGCV